MLTVAGVETLAADRLVVSSLYSTPGRAHYISHPTLCSEGKGSEGAKIQWVASPENI